MQMFGASRGRYSGREVLSFVHSDDANRSRAISSCKWRKIDPFATRNYTLDGETLHISLPGYINFDGGRDPGCHAGNTERKRAEEHSAGLAIPWMQVQEKSAIWPRPSKPWIKRRERG